MTGFPRTGLRGGPLQNLSATEVEGIHQGALQVLEKTGIALHDKQMLRLLAGAGCPVQQEEFRAFLPAAIVEAAVSQAPRVVTLYDRLGQPIMALGAGPLHVRVSSGATGMLDLDDGRRPGP